MKLQELQALEEAHRAAQARLGLLASYLSGKMYQEGGGSNWLPLALLIILVIRRKSRRLYKAYYQYARALETGYTLGLPDGVEEGTGVRLDVLREQFDDILEEIAELGYSVNPNEENDADPDETEFEELAYDEFPEEGEEEGTFLEVDIEEYIDRWRDAIESDGEPDRFIGVDIYNWDEIWDFLDDLYDNLEEVLQQDIIDSNEEMIEKLSEQRESIVDFEQKLKEQEEKNRNKAAGRVDRYAVNDGRRVTPEMIPIDRRIKMVARGLGPNPCYFCAMLASRGFVYRSAVSATAAGGSSSIRRYHDNCHCYPIIHWVDARELPAANAWLQDQWPQITRGTSSKNARRTWRRWWDSTGSKQYQLLKNSPPVASDQTA